MFFFLEKKDYKKTKLIIYKSIMKIFNFYTIIIFLLSLRTIQAFHNKKISPDINIIKSLEIPPKSIVDYLTSIKDYTIITDNDKNKDIEELMNQNNINVYYFNINNLLNKNEILDVLKYNHNNLETAENLWIFYKGHFIGSRNDALKLINKNK